MTTVVGGTAAPTFPLPWSHYVHLLSVRSAEARRFYETEALRGGWTIRQTLPKERALVAEIERTLQRFDARHRAPRRHVRPPRRR